MGTLSSPLGTFTVCSPLLPWTAAVALATCRVTIVTFSAGTSVEEISVDTLNGFRTSKVNLVFEVTAPLLSLLCRVTESIVTFRLRSVLVGLPGVCALTDCEVLLVVEGFPDISDCILDRYTETVPSFGSNGLA